MEDSAERKQVIRTIEMHTGGEPLRIIQSGYPPIEGKTLLEKRRYVREKLDYLRTMLMREPRGHFDMYGALLVESDLPGADLAVLFMHNEGYSTMCGHGVIGLGRYAVDYNLVKPVCPETVVRIQCPCGLVTAHVEYQEGVSGAVRFESVPAFAFLTNQKIDVDGYGCIEFDIGYGGAFYALADATQFGLDLGKSPIQDIIAAGSSLTESVRRSIPLSHPESQDLAFLYGTILTDGRDEFCNEPTANVCIFADCQVDRSPTGSGVTARIAVQYHKQQVKLGEKRWFLQPKVGSLFSGLALREVSCGPYKDAVVVEVSGKANYTGQCSFWCEGGDNLSAGFLLK